jgi:hypothetical protein
MSLGNTQAKYEILVTRTGSAMPVAQEFDQVSKSAAAMTVSARASSAQLGALKESASLTRESFRTLHAASLLLGGHFAEVSIAGQVAVDSMKLVKNAAGAAGIGIGTMSLAIGGAALAIGTLVTGLESLKAFKEMDESAKRLAEQQDIIRKHALEELDLLSIAGKVTTEQYDQLRESVERAGDSYTKMKEAIGAIRALDPSKEETQEVKKLAEMRSQLTQQTMDQQAAEGMAAHDQFLKRREEIRQLYAELYKTTGVNNPGAMDKMLELNEQAFRAQSLQRDGLREQQELERSLTAQAVVSSETRMEQADREFQARNQLYQQLRENGEMTETQLTTAMQDASLKRMEAVKQETASARQGILSMQQQINKVNEIISNDGAQALYDWISGTKSAKNAFRDMAKDILMQLAKMEFQQAIMNSLLVVEHMLLGDGGVRFAAKGGTFGGGGPRYAANGIQSVSSPTYFPKFNVVAGEAGREMLTVLARPRMMSIGGMEAVVGDAGGRKLAIADPAALGGGGVGGRIRIEISHSEDSKAKIIEQSVQRAEVHLIRQSKNNTPYRAAHREGIR